MRSNAAAHSLKGLVSNLHCKAVQDKALEVEALAHNGDRAAMGSAIEVLSRLTQEMMLKVYETRRSLEGAIAHFVTLVATNQGFRGRDGRVPKIRRGWA